MDNASLPTPSQLEEANNVPRQSLRGALQLLAAAPNVKPEEPAETTADDEADINAVDFEYVESFGSDWEERWALGPAVQDENGKEIKTGLINAKLVKLGLDLLLIISYVWLCPSKSSLVMCGVFVFAKVVQENQLFLLLNLSATHPPSFFEEISFQPERCQELLAAYGRCCQCALHWDLDQFQTLNQAHRSGI